MIHSTRKIKIIALTDQGRALADRLMLSLAQPGLELELCFKPKPFSEQVQRAFIQGEALVFICATGIVFRTLAPVLQNKYKDPPVIVLDEAGAFVVPLLSGHEGGANEMASAIAAKIGSQLVLTTANSYVEPVYTVGMGCERGCPESFLINILEFSLKQASISIEQVSSISSIDIKSDEQGLIDLANKLDLPFHTFNKEQLFEVEDLLHSKSDYVFQVVGVYGVAESTALFAAKEAAKKTLITGEVRAGNNIERLELSDLELIVPKQKNAKATCAIARTYRR